MTGAFAPLVEAHRSEMLEFLGRVVGMESPTAEKRHVDAVIDVFADAYQKLGFACRRLPQREYGDHLVADSPDGAGPRVLLVGHADTVYGLGTLGSMPLR